MTTRVARLAADLVANASPFEQSLRRANVAMTGAKTHWNSALQQGRRSFTQFDSHVRKSIGSIVDFKTQLGGLAIAAASALSAQKIVTYSDTWKQLSGRLSIVSQDMAELVQTQEDLFAIAQRTRQPLEGITSFYTRLKQFVPEAERAQYDFLGVTESVAAALAITGETGASAQAAMIQFTQAIGTNFQSAGQEIRSLQEQAPRLTQALVNALGGGEKSLKQLQQEGKLTRQTVLGALGSLSSEAENLRMELDKIPVTVGQALTRLDNAFLRFIGQSAIAARGTSSLAAAITFLADNFDTIARAAAGVAVVFAGQVAGSLYASALAFGAASTGAYAYQLALARMAGISATAATAQLALASAAGLAGRAFAFLGGPAGVAVIGAIALLTYQTRLAGEAQREMNKRLEEHRSAAQEYIFASEERRKAIKQDTQANIESMKQELEAVKILFETYNNKGFLGRFLQNLGGQVGIGDGVVDIVKQGAALEKGIEELEQSLQRFETLGTSANTLGGNTNDKAEKAIKKVIQGLREESELLSLQIYFYGSKQAYIDRAINGTKIFQQLQREGITLTQAQRGEILDLLDTIKDQDLALERQKEIVDRLDNAYKEMGDSIADAFTDAIVEGEKFSDVLDNLLKDLERTIFKATVADPLSGAITDILKDINPLGSLFGPSVGSNATGLDYVPRDMTTRVHQGEAIVQAQELRSLRSAGGGVSVTINNNAGAEVSTQSRETSNGTELLVQLDREMANNIARPGSQTQQALKAFSSRTIVKR